LPWLGADLVFRFSLGDALTVGHPVKPVSLVRGVDGCSRDIDRIPGVTFCLQVRSHSVEPAIASLAANLLAHADLWTAGADESEKVGP
jgi:hypothetical protein